MSRAAAAGLRERVLEPVLDARAINLLEGRALSNDTPEVDSLMEWIDVAAPHLPADVVKGLRDSAQLVHDLNDREGGLERRIAGSTEAIMSGLRLPRDGVSRRRQDLARELRAILRRLDSGDPMAYALAGRDLGRLLDAVPETTLRAGRMERELGRRKYTRLCELLDSLDEARR